MIILTQKQVNNQLNQNYQLNEIKAFFKIAEDMKILKKDPNKVKVKTKTDEYSENLNSKLT